MPPKTLRLAALGYVGAWYFGVQPFLLQRLQSNLNSAAEPFASKYGIAQ